MRIIFFAGKGGVGKTSVAAATGIKAAQAGRRTLVMSLDVAHSLADIFDLERGLIDQNRGKPIKVESNLWIQELDIQEEIEKNWGDIHKYLSTLLNTTGLDEILAEELAILPGMEEVSLLLYINSYVPTNKFDVILLDCAPTGESLRFISIIASMTPILTTGGSGRLSTYGRRRPTSARYLFSRRTFSRERYWAGRASRPWLNRYTATGTRWSGFLRESPTPWSRPTVNAGLR